MQQPLPSVQNLSPGVELHRITTFSNQYYRQAYRAHDPYLYHTISLKYLIHHIKYVHYMNIRVSSIASPRYSLLYSKVFRGFTLEGKETHPSQLHKTDLSVWL